MIKIFNSASGQWEYVNHRLSNFQRITLAVDGTDKRISIFQDGAAQLDVLYDTTVGQENTDYNASVANIDAATV